MKKKLSKIFALLVVVSMIASPVAAQPAYKTASPEVLSAFAKQAIYKADLLTAPAKQLELPAVNKNLQAGNPDAKVVGETKGATEPATYLVTLSDPPLANYEGGIAGLSATLFGLFVVLRGHQVMPKRLRFRNYKPYMRAAYALYLTATLLGVAVYFVWFVFAASHPTYG